MDTINRLQLSRELASSTYFTALAVWVPKLQLVDPMHKPTQVSSNMVRHFLSSVGAPYPPL
jgi:hypothetical protein